MQQAIQTVQPAHERFAQFVTQVEEKFNKIRTRAYELFNHRGYHDGNDQQDWYDAERELFEVASAEMSESDNEISLKVPVPDYKPEDIAVVVTSGSITIHGKTQQASNSQSELQQKELFRHLEFLSTIDPNAVEATIEGGVLTVRMPKAGAEPQVPVKVASAAAGGKRSKAA